MTVSVDPHWRARLHDVQDLVIVAHSVNDVAKALLQLTSVLLDEWDGTRSALPIAVTNELVVLRALVRDASRLLTETDDLGWGGDVKDWQRSAAPFVTKG